MILLKRSDKHERFTIKGRKFLRIKYNIKTNIWSIREENMYYYYQIHFDLADKFDAGRNEIILNGRLSLASNFVTFKLFLICNNLVDIYYSICKYV